MGYFGDLYYAEKERPFVGLPIEDIKATNKLLSEKYISNKEQSDYLDMMEQNLNSLNEKDAAIVKRRIDLTRDGIKNFTERGDWWNAGGTVKGLYKDFATDKGVQLTQSNYAARQEYEKWLDSEGSKLGWSEEERIAASNTAMKYYKGVSFVNEAGEEIEYNDQNKDEGRFAGVFNGRVLGENLSLDKYVWEAIGSKYGEPDVTPRSTYYNNKQGYWITVKGKDTFISKDEVASTTRNLIETDPKIRRWYDDVNYLESNSPMLAVSKFERLLDTSLYDKLSQEKYKGSTATERKAEFNTRYENEKEKIYSEIGLNSTNRDAFFNKLHSGEALNPDENIILRKMVAANRNLTTNMVVDNSTSRYAYAQQERDYDLQADEMYMFKAKHALEKEWEGEFKAVEGKGQGEIVTAFDITALSKGVSDLTNEQATLNAQLAKATTLSSRNGIQIKLNEVNTKLANARNNIKTLYSKGDDNIFIDEVAKSNSFPKFIVDVLGNSSVSDMTASDRSKLVKFLNAELKSRGSNTIIGNYDTFDANSIKSILDKPKVSYGMAEYSTGKSLPGFGIPSPEKSYDEIKTVIKNNYNKGSFVKPYLDYKVNTVTNPRFITNSEYAASVKNYYEGESEKMIDMDILSSTDKDDITKAKSTFYSDWIKSTSQLLQSGASFSTIMGANVNDYIATMKGKVSLANGKDEDSDGNEISLSTKNTTILPTTKAYNGDMYYQVSFNDSKGQPLYAKDNKGNLVPIIKYLKSDNPMQTRNDAFLAGRRMYNSAKSPKDQQTAIKLMANANFADITTFSTNDVPNNYGDVVPITDLSGNTNYIGIVKEDNGITTYKTKKSNGARVIDYNNPMTVRTSSSSGIEDVNRFNDVQDLIYKMQNSMLNNY